MKSRWFGLKPKAIKLRKGGKSIPYVEKKLGIPRSTLSGWFKNIELSSRQKKVLDDNWRKALVAARSKAVIWHNQQKAHRLKIAQDQAFQLLKKLDVSNSDILDVALSFLYLGEGFKKAIETGIGNSDPLILKFFISVLEKNYNVTPSQIKCELHLRADQKPEEIKIFWSKTLGIPIKNFKNTSIDYRTKGTTTYPHYKGVCVLRCGNVAIQRKLVYFSEMFCKKVIGED